MKVITIGRSTENDVVIQDPNVSRHHCQIVQKDNGTYGLVDFGSSNGTYINGQRISGQVVLNPNDVVRIGNTTLPWRNYFEKSFEKRGEAAVKQAEPTVQPHAPIPQKSNTKPLVIILVVLAIVALLVVGGIFLFNNMDNDDKATSVQSENERANTSTNSNTYGEDSQNSSTTYQSDEYSSSGFSDVDISGNWKWQSNDLLFEMELYESYEGRIVGTYCFICGEHWMDCDEENIVEENRSHNSREDNTVQVKFSSAGWGGHGTALITKYSDDRIRWQLRDVEGDSRVPDDVILERSY